MHRFGREHWKGDPNGEISISPHMVRFVVAPFA
jgi:hypothetical protein